MQIVLYNIPLLANAVDYQLGSCAFFFANLSSVSKPMSFMFAGEYCSAQDCYTTDDCYFSIIVAIAISLYLYNAAKRQSMIQIA